MKPDYNFRILSSSICRIESFCVHRGWCNDARNKKKRKWYTRIWNVRHFCICTFCQPFPFNSPLLFTVIAITSLFRTPLIRLLIVGRSLTIENFLFYLFHIPCSTWYASSSLWLNTWLASVDISPTRYGRSRKRSCSIRAVFFGGSEERVKRMEVVYGSNFKYRVTLFIRSKQPWIDPGRRPFFLLTNLLLVCILRASIKLYVVRKESRKEERSCRM